jgi:osmotically-inducible protein OsmY
MIESAAIRANLLKLGAVAFAAMSLAACQTTSLSGASSVIEFRTNGEVLDDKSIEAKIDKGIADLSTQYVMDVEADSYIGRVLLTGTAGAAGAKDSVERVARSTPEVTAVYNEIQVAGEESVTRDLTIAGKVKAKLLATKGVTSTNYTIRVVNAVVYIIGVAESNDEFNTVLNVARNIADVKQVVNYINIDTSRKG